MMSGIIFNASLRPKYYIPETTKPIFRLFRELVLKQRPMPDFPKDVQIQTMTGCNSRCIFCPHGKTRNPILPGQEMSWDNFTKIVDEILSHDVNRISPYLMNEPFMDKRLPELISYMTRKKSKYTVTKVNSNGSLLTETLSKALLDSGLDRLNFSVHGIVAEEYERTMVGIKLTNVLHNIDRFLELKNAGGYDRPRVRVTMVRTRILEPQIPQIIEYWGSRNIKVNIQPLENRSHDAIHKQNLGVHNHKLKPFLWCDRMFKQIYILADGRVVLCCVDWEQTTIMGDARRESVFDIWHNNKYQEYRRNFLNGDLRGMLCNKCMKASC